MRVGEVSVQARLPPRDFSLEEAAEAAGEVDQAVMEEDSPVVAVILARTAGSGYASGHQ